MVEKAFDKTRLKQIDQATKAMANAHYEHCLYKCDLKASDSAGACKQLCFKNVMVPYHMIKHQAQDSEENLYRQCLADRMPNISQNDYAQCTNNIYAQRVELLMSHYANTAEKILGTIH